MSIDQRFTETGNFVVDIDESGKINLDYGWQLKHSDYPVDSVLVPALEIAEIGYWYEGRKGEAGVIGQALKQIATYLRRHKEILTVRKFAESQYFRTPRFSAQAA